MTFTRHNALSFLGVLVLAIAATLSAYSHYEYDKSYHINPTPHGGTVVPDQIVITFKPGIPIQRYTHILNDVGAVSVSVIVPPSTVLIRLQPHQSAADLEQTMVILRQLPEVQDVSQNIIHTGLEDY